MKNKINDIELTALWSTTVAEPLSSTTGPSAAANTVTDHEDSAGGETDDTEDAEDPNSSLPPRLRFIKPSDVSDKFLDVSATSICQVGTQGNGKKVTVIDYLSHLVKLQRLMLRSNLIRHIGGLEKCTTLVILELYENKIKSLTGLEKLVNLKVLDLSYNRIRFLNG